MAKEGCVAGSCGCLIVGIIIGAVVVWLFMPELRQHGLTPENAADKVEKSAARLADEAAEVRDRVSALKDTVSQPAAPKIPPQPQLKNK